VCGAVAGCWHNHSGRDASAPVGPGAAGRPVVAGTHPELESAIRAAASTGCALSLASRMERADAGRAEWILSSRRGAAGRRLSGPSSMDASGCRASPDPPSLPAAAASLRCCCWEAWRWVPGESGSFCSSSWGCCCALRRRLLGQPGDGWGMVPGAAASWFSGSQLLDPELLRWRGARATGGAAPHCTGLSGMTSGMLHPAGCCSHCSWTAQAGPAAATPA
jgi:hypothetical protein